MGKARQVSPVAWSGWQPLPSFAPLDPAVLAEILDGGQAFRWHRVADDGWMSVFDTHLVRLSLETGVLRWSAPVDRAEASGPALVHYFNGAATLQAPLALPGSPAAGQSAHAFPRAQDGLPALVDSLPWRSDPHLARCLGEFPGLRILRQPFGETLLCFLCSATKQIVQIKQMVSLLAERHGARLLPVTSPAPGPLPLPWRLPTWPELALIPEAELRACQLGFRARYIHETARWLAAHPGWLEETETLPYATAKERLCSLPGVGEKVADCVLLFGAGRLEAFPVDTWILKAMAARYGLHGWKPDQVAHFGRIHFGPLAGLAQQYLFSWERKHSAR